MFAPGIKLGFRVQYVGVKVLYHLVNVCARYQVCQLPRHCLGQLLIVLFKRIIQLVKVSNGIFLHEGFKIEGLGFRIYGKSFQTKRVKDLWIVGVWDSGACGSCTSVQSTAHFTERAVC